MADNSNRGRRNGRKKGVVPLENSLTSSTRFEPPVFGPSGAYEGSANPLHLTNSNVLEETRERVGWDDHTHNARQPAERVHSNNASTSNHQMNRGDAAATLPSVAENVDYGEKAYPPNTSSEGTADSSVIRGNQYASYPGLQQVLNQLQHSTNDPAVDAESLLTSLQDVLVSIGRMDIAQHLHVYHPMNLDQQPSDSVESPPPQSASAVQPISVNNKDPDVTMNDRPEPARLEVSSRPDSIEPSQDVYNFLRELEEKWGPSRPTSFSKEDAVQLQKLFNLYQGYERDRLTSLLGYSGNKVESIRRVIQVFLDLKQNRRGFIGDYNPQSGHTPSQLLKAHLVVKLRGSAKYMTPPCGRFSGRSKCSHCSENKNDSQDHKQRWRSWQHVMICLSASLQGRRKVWFCFEMDCSLSCSTSENLERHRSGFHLITKPGTKPTPSASQEQAVAGTPAVDIPMTSGPNPNPSPPTNSAQVENVSEPSGQTSKKAAMQKRPSPGYNAPPSRPLPHQHPPMPNAWPGQTLPPFSTPLMPPGSGVFPYPNQPFGSTPYYTPSGPPQPVNPGAIPHGHPGIMGINQPWDIMNMNMNGNGYGYGGTIPMGGAQATAPSPSQVYGYRHGPGSQQAQPNGGFCPPLNRPHLPNCPPNAPFAAPPQIPRFQHNMGPQPALMYNNNMLTGQVGNKLAPSPQMERGS